jgi:hypothetical protein
MLNSMDITDLTLEEPSTIKKTSNEDQIEDPENVPNMTEHEGDEDDEGDEAGKSFKSKLETEPDKPVKRQPEIVEAAYIRYFNLLQWYYRNTRSLMVETRISLEKHEPENAD